MKQSYGADTRGAPMDASSQPFNFSPPRVEVVPPPLPTSADYHHEAARGVCQAYGLHPISGITTLTANAMLFGGMILSMGALLPMALIVAVVLAYLTYRCQRSMYGDTHDAALVKALAVGLITAIPVGLPAFLTVPSTVVGIVHTLRRKVN
jgi:hypothetical protein